ncbi:hypothetical protein [Flavobacterium sp. Root186]|uniref:hypothetical protein n=1 Tax=Flavobacterium sp. Root186 TaxID=1736485 RepID=UPI0006F35137|nr:hypothetical protein [Flavobacterium sp. Root186]KRB58436.1 hypothetical protein ASD98_23605 [Flavobacterium sp. Root186]
MKKNLLSLWLFVWAVFFTAGISAQTTIGNISGKPKAAETFSAVEVVSNGKGGLRLPQLTTAQRNTLAIGAISDPVKKGLANGLTIYNTTTNCVEYWNATRWISLCEGTSMTKISPEPCTAEADGTGCNQTFTVTDEDCPNGPFSIAIMAGSEYAVLSNINSTAGTFKINFNVNESITPHTVLVRVTSSCTGQFKDFLFMQKAIECDTTLGSVPAVSPSNGALTLCSGGAVYLSIPSSTANLSKVIWTRNGIEVARGVNYYAATMPGTYNISLGAAGCNEIASNARVITESGTSPAVINTIVASNNGIICGPSGTITLTASGASGAVTWFKNGELTSKTGTIITLTGSVDQGAWFAAAGSNGCYSKQSNTVTITVQTPTGTPITLNNADVLINNKAINEVTSFCSEGNLVLKVNNPQPGVSYTWYNDKTIITSPYKIPADIANILIRMVATDNSGAACPVEASTITVPITGGAAPGTPTITSLTGGVLCNGTADLTVTPQQTGTYTYQWYKNGVAMTETTQTITVDTPGVTYTATVTNATGCASAPASKTIPMEESTIPVLDWKTTSTTANNGDRIFYETKLLAGSATSYEWTVDGVKLSATTSSTTITIPATGTSITIKVKGTNACGTSEEITKVVNVSPLCPTPVVSASTGTTASTVAGIGKTMGVSVTNGNTQTYQWYSNTTASVTGGSAISGATSASYTYTPAAAGTMYFYCIVTNGCAAGITGTSPVFAVNVSANPEALPAGSGILVGKTCFDINKAPENDGGTCGSKTIRTVNMTNFATQNVQNYVFTASSSGAKRNLRFVVVDANGAVQSTNADAVAVPGTVGNSQVVTLVVTYKNTLSDSGSIVWGRTAANAINVKIYAVYNDGTKDVAVQLNVKIQDCACCGAFVAAGVWKSFMCHNLGADASLDYTVIQNGLIGDHFLIGQKVSLEKGNLAIPTTSMYYNYNASRNPGSESPKKGVSDPCPAGYRIPTNSEWEGVVANNTYSRFGTSYTSSSNLTSMGKIGELLYMPMSGYNQLVNGAVIPSGLNVGGYYWSADGPTTSAAVGANTLVVGSDMRASVSYVFTYWQGWSVRCMEL